MTGVVDSKSPNTPSWQSKSKPAHSDNQAFHVFFGFCVMAHVLLFAMSLDPTRLCLTCVVRRNITTRTYNKCCVKELCKFPSLLKVERSFCCLCRCSVKETANQRASCEAFPNTFLIGLQVSTLEYDINMKPLRPSVTDTPSQGLRRITNVSMTCGIDCCACR